MVETVRSWASVSPGGAVAKALLLGAKTVNGPAPLSVATSVGMSLPGFFFSVSGSSPSGTPTVTGGTS